MEAFCFTNYTQIINEQETLTYPKFRKKICCTNYKAFELPSRFNVK
jgi:hypothetical protein